MSKEKLENAKKYCYNAENLTEEEADLITNEFIHQLRAAENIQSPHTFTKHLQKLRNIARGNPELDLTQLEITEELNKEIRRQIQNSEYKKQPGEYSKKNKDDHWTAWKYFLKHCHNLSQPENDNRWPHANFSSKKSKVDKQADTRPEHLPTPRQMRKLLKAMRQVSNQKVADRNIALYLLIWDLGTRKMETLPIQMKQVDISQDRIKIFVEGNKTSGDDWIRVFQGEQFLREYIENHPKSGDPEAYLFPRTYYNVFDEYITADAVEKKMRQARNYADLDFKVYGEPFHIFRKAMTTYYVLNDILSWEEVCERQRKKPDATKPDYLLMAMEDVDRSAAEGFGLETGEADEKEDDRSGMRAPPLLPKDCTGCGRVNTCLADSCVECGLELEENSIPKSNAFESDERIGIDADTAEMLAVQGIKNMSDEEKKEILEGSGLI